MHRCRAEVAAFLSIGFRPLYLCAAGFAALAVPAWYAAYAGWITLNPVLPAPAWHAHEMLFGFAPAVIVGFLFTAARNWTGLPTPSGMGLAALVALWLAARLLMLTGPGPVAVVADVGFLVVAAASLALPLWRSRNYRNAFVVPLLMGLALLSWAHHSAVAGYLDPIWMVRTTTLGLDLVALLLTVIGGRIIPAFSANAVPGLKPRRWHAIDAAAVGLAIAVGVVDLSAATTPWAIAGGRGLLWAAAAVQLLRLAGWMPWRTRHNTLLLVLPLGYLWLPVHFALRALLDPAPGHMAPAALHALSVGAMGGLMLAMMTRSALGHTGRPLAGRDAEGVMFAAVHLAAITRVAGLLAWPAAAGVWLGTSAALWALAFAAFAVVYAPILVRPRST
ncbi:MAG: NnrS family protein [Pseudomonadales bacterium]